MLKEKSKDLKTVAYDSIKELIILNEFKQGKQLKIEELENILRISRTPIREALLKLANESFVRIKPRVGFFVRGITKKEFDELFEIRELVEVFAVKKTVKLITLEGINVLKNLDIKARELIKQIENNGLTKDDISKFLGMEKEFHSYIINNAHNNNLTIFMEKLDDLIARQRMLAIQASFKNVYDSIDEHHNIIEAIKYRDIMLAANLMRSHLVNAKYRLKSYNTFEIS